MPMPSHAKSGAGGQRWRFRRWPILRVAARVWADFDWRRGEADFQRALQLDSNDAARIALGRVRPPLGQPAVAARLTEQALVNDSLNARAWHALGTYLMSLQRLDRGRP